jgi:Integrase core domain
VKDYLQPLRPPRVARATLRYEPAPREQAQVDFGSFPYEAAGRRCLVYAFCFTLSYSRALYVEFVEHQDLTTVLWGHAQAFTALGGVPQTILYDNLKPVTLGRDAQGQPLWQSRFADFALLLGFRPTLCAPYRAQTKGRVERAIGYLRQSFWPGTRFTDLVDLNRQVATWCAEVANQRVHGTTGERPADRLAAERLHPLPAHLVLTPFFTSPRKVSRDGFVSLAGSRYGVPWQHAGTMVEVAHTTAHVEILVAGRPIATHERVPAGATCVLPDQWHGLPLGGSSRPQRALAYQVPGPDVAVRPLSVYAAMAEETPR